MKQIIVLTACLPILLILLLQIAQITENYSYDRTVHRFTYQAAEAARIEGCFTDANISDLKHKISQKTGVAEDMITITATQNIKYRRNAYDPNALLEYKVEVPVEKIMAGAGFFGISKEQNTGCIIIEGVVSSERLSP